MQITLLFKMKDYVNLLHLRLLKKHGFGLLMMHQMKKQKFGNFAQDLLQLKNLIDLRQSSKKHMKTIKLKNQRKSEFINNLLIITNIIYIIFIYIY